MNGVRLFSPLLRSTRFRQTNRTSTAKRQAIALLLNRGVGSWIPDQDLRVGNPVFVQIASQTEFPVVNPAS